MLRYRSLIVTNKKPKIAPLTEQYSINLEVILKIDVFVAQIIKAPNFDNFTTSDVRSSYITLSNDPSLDPTVVRRKLYAELLKLVKKGWLNKKSTGRKGSTRFSKTELFDPEYLEALQANKSTAKYFKEEKQKNLNEPFINTRILGKIRAIEGLLEQDKSVEKI